MKIYHFTLKELCASETARKLGIDNTPKFHEYIALASLVTNVLEPMREWLNAPLLVTSGFRCYELNKAVGGVENSEHLIGEAADITTGTRDGNIRLYEWAIVNLEYDQLILKNKGTYIHVSFSMQTKNRMHAFVK